VHLYSQSGANALNANEKKPRPALNIWIHGGVKLMNTLSLAIALITGIAVCVMAQSVLADYWIITDAAGMPTVTDKQPTDSPAGVRGPFKYYDQAVRDMGTGTEWRARCYITGQCTTAKQLGK